LTVAGGDGAFVGLVVAGFGLRLRLLVPVLVVSGLGGLRRGGLPIVDGLGLLLLGHRSVRVVLRGLALELALRRAVRTSLYYETRRGLIGLVTVGVIVGGAGVVLLIRVAVAHRSGPAAVIGLGALDYLAVLVIADRGH